MNDEKLIGYISGEITSKIEIVEILDWIESSAENQKRYNQLKNLWVVSRLDHPDQVTIPAFSYPAPKRILLQNTPFGLLLKYAAVFIFAFIMGSLSLHFFSKNQNAELSSLYNTIRSSKWRTVANLVVRWHKSLAQFRNKIQISGCI